VILSKQSDAGFTQHSDESSEFILIPNKTVTKTTKKTKIKTQTKKIKKNKKKNCKKKNSKI
jgi:hypothetical protein